MSKKQSIEEHLRPYGLHGRLCRLNFLLKRSEESYNLSCFSSFFLPPSSSSSSSSSFLPFFLSYFSASDSNRTSSAAHVPFSRVELLKYACKLFKQLNCTQKYVLFLSELSSLTNNEPNEDLDFDRTFHTNADFNDLQQKLEKNLQHAKAARLYKGIRQAVLELAHFLKSQAEYEAAFKVLKTHRDFFNSENTQVEYWEELLGLCTLSGRYEEIYSAMRKLSESSHASKYTDKIVAALMGLYYMRMNRYDMAAASFNRSQVYLLPSVGHSVEDIFCVSDIAVYTSLCTLASLSRHELGLKMEEKSSFREHAALVPELNNFIMQFFYCNYGEACSQLLRLAPILSLDINLQPVLKDLIDRIYKQAFVQHVSAFRTISITNMALAFQVSSSALEEELTNLVGEGKINGRIDTIDKVLQICERDFRLDTFEESLRLEEELADSCQLFLLRMHLLRNDMAIRARKSTSKA